jgi:hypothetical protein
LGFPGHPLVPVGGVFKPILRRASVEREQANDRVTASALAVDTGIGNEFDRLPDVEFML